MLLCSVTTKFTEKYFVKEQLSVYLQRAELLEKKRLLRLEVKPGMPHLQFLDVVLEQRKCLHSQCVNHYLSVLSHVLRGS